MAARTPKRVAKKPIVGERALRIGETELKQLIRLLERRDVGEFEYEDERLRVRISRGARAAAPQVATTYTAHAVSSPSSQAALATELRVQTSVPADVGEGDSFVTSPFVGTFYRSPSPDAPSFVEIGSSIREGQALCIIEAMKLMNEIEAEVAGKVSEVLVENGQPVEFGQPLFRIDPV